MPGFETNFISMYDLIMCITNASDLISPELANHHQQVAYMAFKISEQMGLTIEQKKEMVLAGLLHDVGAISLNERLELNENEPDTSQTHAIRGANLLRNFEPLRGASEIIRYHHVPWNYGNGLKYNGDPVPVMSHILHLADRIAVLIDRRQDVINQMSDIVKTIRAQRDKVFMPDAVDAFEAISGTEYIWLDMVYKPLLYIFPVIVPFDLLQLDMDEVISLTRIFSAIIDFRSPFTANHSAGVAATAVKLAEFAGYSKKERKMMLVAGQLHDLGKLAVRNEILEKPGKLNEVEFNEIKRHTYYTYRLLQPIKGFEVINQWASFHHEKLDGSGYPFHLHGDELSLGSRIMAVADIFTAITENRPYRKGMPAGKVISIIRSMSRDGLICPYVVSLLLKHFNEIDSTRRLAQKRAEEYYRNYLN